MLMTPTTDTLTLQAKLFRGLADRSRLAILEALREGPRRVGDIVLVTGLSQPNVSNHLACLHDCGLVAREQQGRYVAYRLSDARVADLLTTVEAVLREVATRVYACAHYQEEPDA